MSASLNDKITDVRNAARPNSARVTLARSVGGGTLTCDNLVGWPTASKVHFVTYTIDSNSNPVAGTQMDCYGIVSGNTITSFTVSDVSDLGNSVNDVVEMLPTAAWGQDLADALTASHNRDGTPKTAVTYPASTFVTPTIASFTNAQHDHSNAAGGGKLTSTGITSLALNLTTLSNPYKFKAYRAAALSLASNSKIVFDTEQFDTNNNFDTTTGLYTAPVAGFYYFTCATALVINGNQNTAYGTAILVNGLTNIARNEWVNMYAGSYTLFFTCGGLVQLAAGDTAQANVTASSGTNPLAVGAEATYFTGFLVSQT